MGDSQSAKSVNACERRGEKLSRWLRIYQRNRRLGCRMNVMLACLSFSMLTALLARGAEREYAIELISDASWKVYRHWAFLPKLFARLVTRNAAKRLRICVNAFLRFPFNSPGYRFEREPSDQEIAFNILRCPVASFLQQQGAADLCVASWCNLDFALAEK